MDLDPVAPFLLLLLLVVAALLAFVYSSQTPMRATVKPLLTDKERRLFEALTISFGKNYLIFPKVAATSVLQSGSHAFKVDEEATQIFRARHIDFLICNRSDGSIAAALFVSQKSDSTGDRFRAAAKSAFFGSDIPVEQIDLDDGFVTSDLAAKLKLSPSPGKIAA